jgi:hypothetical protein
MSALTHNESSEALARGPYAKRYRPWPPEGYAPPTGEEFRQLAEKIRRHGTYTLTRMGRDKIQDEVIIRHMQLIEIFPDQRGAKIYDYTRWLREEMNRRKITHKSIKLPRCGLCSHASERLWEVTPETHNIIEHDKPWSGFVCSRCWSEYLITED